MLLILSDKKCYFQKEAKTNNAFGKGGHRPSRNCADTASIYSSMFSSPSNKNHFFVTWMELQPVYFYFNASLLSRHQKSNESVDSGINKKKNKMAHWYISNIHSQNASFRHIMFQTVFTRYRYKNSACKST